MHEQAAVKARVAPHGANRRDRHALRRGPHAGAHADHHRARDAREREGTEREGHDVGDSPRAADHAGDECERAGPRRDQQPVAQHFAARGPPRQRGPDGHQEQQREADRHAHLGEVGLADGELLVLERLHEQREHCAGQNNKCERTEQQIVEQEGGLTRDR